MKKIAKEEVIESHKESKDIRSRVLYLRLARRRLFILKSIKKFIT